MKYIQINASILFADFARLGNDIKLVLESGVDNIHFDVMDNHYVPNLTFGPMILKSLRNFGIMSGINVHLMVKPVDSLIKDFAKAGATSIVFHPEGSNNISRSLKLIKSFDIQAGLVLNPTTKLECIKYFKTDIDRILIMSVNPGFGGQKFIYNTLIKIFQTSQWIKSIKKNILLEIDGGINMTNINEILKYDINAVVIGSTIFNAINYKDVINQIRSLINKKLKK